MGGNVETALQEFLGEKPDAGVAFQYIDIFKPPINPSQLPCLVLFTTLEDKAVVRSLPDWEESSLYELIEVLSGMTRQCAEETDKEKRLQNLQNLLSSPGAIILDNGKHVANEMIDYCRKQPAQVLNTTIGITLALTTGNVFALSPTAIDLLKAIKDALK
jgi:hypothetical protein